MGDGIFYVVAALYFTRIVGLDPVHYGAALTASWWCSFQYRVAKGVRSIDDGLRTLRWSGLLLFAGATLYAVSGTPRSPLGAALALLAAVVVLTLGEMQQTASMTEISFRLVPDRKYGQYQGFFGMGWTQSEAITPSP